MERAESFLIFNFFFNGMLRHSLRGAVIFISLQHLIAPASDVMPCFQARGTRDCYKGIKFKKGAKMYSRKEVKFASSA